MDNLSAELRQVIIILAGYLLGSIPFPYIVTKLATGKDVRYEGNGNVGTRNTIRLAGRPAGLLALLLDAGKGAAAYVIAHRFPSDALTLYLTGIALLLGHWFPLWLGGRGGIGQAAVTGFVAAMWPLSALEALPIFVLARLANASFVLAYVIAASVFLALSLWRGNSLYDAFYVVGLVGCVGLKKLVNTPRHQALLATQEGDNRPDTFLSS